MTPKIPLNLKIKKKSQRDIAYAQDIMVEELYRFFPKAIIHGGTTIWRCYNGNRFSEDVDVYIPKDEKQINNFLSSLEIRGFIISKKRIKENSVYVGLTYNTAKTRFEATFQTKKSIFKKFETSESFFINVFTLSTEDLIIEKIDTYLKRRKIRDLYDIFFLLNYVDDISLIKDKLKKFVNSYQKPLDENNLKEIILSGAVPSSKQLIESITRRI